MKPEPSAPSGTGLPEPAPALPGDDRPARGAAWFVWSAWALLITAALALVAGYGRDVPFYDELSLVPVLAGEQPITAEWLWSAHNGHRLPLPRLLLLGLLRLTGCDFRAGMYVNVVALGGLALAMIRTAQGVRGRPAYTDAFFPLVLLHWGHAQNLLWTWQVVLVLPVALAGVLLLLIVRPGTRLAPAGAAGAGAALLALPLCGVSGLVYVPALALWLGGVAVQQWRSPARTGRGWGVAIGALAAAALGLVAYYLVDYQYASYYRDSWRLSVLWRTGLQFLTGGFGPAGQLFWPLSGWVVLGLFVLTGGRLLLLCRRGRPGERARAVGLLLFLAAVGCLAASVGAGRPGAGFAPRYYVLAAPALCGVYFAWTVGNPRADGRLAPTALFTLAALTFSYNFQQGRTYAEDHRDKADALERDLAAGEPVYQILARHAATLYPYPFGEGSMFHDWLDDCLRQLHRAGIGKFRLMRTEPPDFQEVPLPLGAALVRPGEAGTDQKPYRLLALSRPRFAYAIRVHFRGPAQREVRVYWAKEAQEHLTPSRRCIQYSTWGVDAERPGERMTTVWVCDTVAQVGLQPQDEPGSFEVTGVALLVPSREPAAGLRVND